MPKKDTIQDMFDSIAPDYDRLNHILSLNVDESWRRRALKKIVDPCKPLEILDLACGTGDFSIAIARAQDRYGGHVTGVDLSQGMLDVMKGKVLKSGLARCISMEVGDGEELRFGDGSFDRVAIAFGIRNFENREKGIKEMLRVLKPGGRLVILELSVPENKVLRWLYELYFFRILPCIGGRLSGDGKAYSYLPASVKGFPGKAAFMETLSSCGFARVSHQAFTFGLCRMYIGEKEPGQKD